MSSSLHPHGEFFYVSKTDLQSSGEDSGSNSSNTMKTPPTDIYTTLIHQLDKIGIESNTIPRLIKDLIISLSDNPSMSLFQVNSRLHGLGWDDIELDYHTFQLVKACFENGSLKSLQV